MTAPAAAAPTLVLASSTPERQGRAIQSPQINELQVVTGAPGGRARARPSDCGGHAPGGRAHARRGSPHPDGRARGSPGGQGCPRLGGRACPSGHGREIERPHLARLTLDAPPGLEIEQPRPAMPTSSSGRAHSSSGPAAERARLSWRRSLARRPRWH